LIWCFLFAHWNMLAWEDTEMSFDLEADKKMVKEVLRVLKPKGLFVFTTEVDNEFYIDFNANRVYSPESIRDMYKGMTPIEEDITRGEGETRGIYKGCWRK